jgi:hypothetical protein
VCFYMLKALYIRERLVARPMKAPANYAFLEHAARPSSCNICCYLDKKANEKHYGHLNTGNT